MLPPTMTRHKGRGKTTGISRATEEMADDEQDGACATAKREAPARESPLHRHTYLVAEVREKIR